MTVLEKVRSEASNARSDARTEIAKEQERALHGAPQTEELAPKPCRPVAYRGRMTKEGYQPENHEWLGQLCERDENGRLAGRDPLALSLELLTAAGHAEDRVRGVNHRLAVMHGTASGEMRGCGPTASSLTSVRQEVCIPCSSESLAEVRRCAIVDCPAWPYRMGRNPHNPRRGHLPDAFRKEPAE